MAARKRRHAQLTKPKGKAQQNRGYSADMLRSALALNVQARRDHLNDPSRSAFSPTSVPQPPPGVLPKDVGAKLAMDTQILGVNAWALGQLQNAAMLSGITFLGFPYLSELAQIAEYRYIAEVTATEMTREWIELKSIATKDESKEEKIKELEEFLKTLDVQGHFRRLAELDYLFGRSHLYIDTGDTDSPDELKVPIGNGRDAKSKAKAKKGFLHALKVVEPIWCYPAEYTSNNPLRQDWYNPQSWYALGSQIHVSRLLTFVGREVPDMLKPSYMFGGLAMSQMAQITVNNWLRARKSVSDLLYRYSVNILSTEMDASTAEGGAEMITRAQLLTEFLNNNGVLMLDKESEQFDNVSTPLSGIEQLQAQAQEHMSAVSRIPLVKLTGISPMGLNASSEGEIQVWYEWIKSYQEKFFSKHLDSVIAFSMITLWGDVDKDIVWEFRPLRALSAKELAELQKLNSETDMNYVSTGAIGPEDLRNKLSADPMTPYDALGEGDDLVEPDTELEDDGVHRGMTALMTRLAREGQRDGEREGGREQRPPRGSRPGRDRTGRGVRPREPRPN